MCKTHGLRERKVVENETGIYLVWTKKENQRFIQIVTSIPGEFQHAIDIDKWKIGKVVRKTCAERRR